MGLWTLRASPSDNEGDVELSVAHDLDVTSHLQVSTEGLRRETGYM